MTRKRKSNKAGVGFANSLLQAVAESSGGGWFTDNQQKKLRLLIRNEFCDLADAGLLYDDVQLDQLEHASELLNFPNGNRPNHLVDEEDPEEHAIEVEEIEISEVIEGPPDDDPVHAEEEPAAPDPLAHPNCRVVSIE